MSMQNKMGILLLTKQISANSGVLLLVCPRTPYFINWYRSRKRRIIEAMRAWRDVNLPFTKCTHESVF